ncbi:MAG: hypothetical protein IJR13_02175 [Bacteroidales bacterium]|nr:hypothetical protein [Bacteroidales bacterium]
MNILDAVTIHTARITINGGNARRSCFEASILRVVSNQRIVLQQSPVSIYYS